MPLRTIGPVGRGSRYTAVAYDEMPTTFTIADFDALVRQSISRTPPPFPEDRTKNQRIFKQMMDAITECAPHEGRLHAACGRDAYLAVTGETGSQTWYCEHGPVSVTLNQGLPKHVIVMNNLHGMFRHLIINLDATR